MKLKLTLVFGVSLLLAGCGALVTAPRVQKTPRVQKSLPQKILPKAKVEEEPEVERERVATLELINKAGLTREEVSYLSNLVRQAAGRLPQSKYGVITKENIMVMLPQGKRLEDCDMGCAVQTGREIGAHWVVTGEVVKFGGELRVSLSLHHSQSGELRGSGTVKAREVKELEGPLQGEAVGLFGSIDPSLKRVAERLKRGFVFEKVTLGALPDVPQLDEEAEVRAVEMPSAVQANVMKGVGFGKIDVEGLQLYDKALKADKDSSVSPEAKIRLWREVLSAKVSGVEGLAQERVEAWEGIIQQMAERERRKQEALRELAEIEAQDAQQAREREGRMERDWAKLSKLLPLEVVSEEDKLSWVEAFLEAYGAVRELNPHLRDATLQRYARKLGERLAMFEREGRAEAQRRASRAREIAAKRCELETGVEGERCLVERERERLGGIEFVAIPAGSFMMGSNEGDSDEKPVHRVRVPAFLMSKTEVTVGQYRRCVEAGRCSEPDTGGYKDACNWGKSGREDHPINCVDWGQARTFAKWVGADVDLPTEAEWEYAARGGQSFKYAGSNDADKVAWYGSNSGGSTHSVGTKKANGFGLHDMSGNVWEWTLDEYKSSYLGAPSDGSQARGKIPTCRSMCDNSSAGRVFRGGGWLRHADHLRVAFRNYDSPVYRHLYLGFRLRRTLP